MSQVLSSLLSVNLNTSSGTYIYDIISTSPSSTPSSPLASITSNDTLTILDPSTLSVITSINAIHGGDKVGVTSLRALNDNVLVTSGRDSVVNLWDLRSAKKVNKLRSVANPAQEKPFISLAASSTYHAIAAGEEYNDYAAKIFVWDIRNNKSSPLRQYTESHNDDITEIIFDESSVSNLLLSGSTDGLVNVYDLNAPNTNLQKREKSRVEEEQDDEEALYQVINHGSSIHHAGFLPYSSDRKGIFAISHDEKLTIYKLNSEQDIEKAEEETAKPDEKCGYGDLRQKIPGCDYVVDLIMSDGLNPSLIAGSNKGEQKQNWLDIIPLRHVKGGGVTSWKLALKEGFRLAGAHGQEVVRCIKVFEQARTIFTGGEDGLIKVWRVPNGAREGDKAEDMDIDNEETGVPPGKLEKRKKIDKKNKKGKGRYKPY